jgi:putative peptidoglycan lipid II flippase
VQTILNIIGSVFVAIYVEHIWIVVSLSLVTSGSILIQSVLAFLMFKRRFGSLGHAHLTLATAKFAAAALVAGLIGFSILQAMGGANPGAFPVLSIVASTLTCALIGGVMVVVYLLILRFLKVKEIETLTKPLMRLLGRS